MIVNRPNPLHRHGIRVGAAAIALSLGLMLGGCGGMATNAGLESIHQPVVQRDAFVFDVTTLPGGGLSLPEQRRLAGWLDALGLKYGDKVAVDDPMGSDATRDAVGAIVAAHGMILADTAPITPGDVLPGYARVVVSRMVASVPGCPDWSAKSDANAGNATSTNFGCAINSNLAAMVADKEHLVHGATGTGETVIMSSSKAIDSYRAQEPTGKGGLKSTSSKGN